MPRCGICFGAAVSQVISRIDLLNLLWHHAGTALLCLALRLSDRALQGDEQRDQVPRGCQAFCSVLLALQIVQMKAALRPVASRQEQICNA